jgi:hypothetical protein
MIQQPAQEQDKTESPRADATVQNHSDGNAQPSNDIYCPPRQRGCEAYEALSGVEKIEVCPQTLPS